MIDHAELTTWWQKELMRDFTKLECGLLGALFAAITVILFLLVRVQVG